MNAVFARLFSRQGRSVVVLRDKQPPAAEPLEAVPRPLTGFFSHLTPAQQQAALDYRGSENHGEAEFQRKPG